METAKTFMMAITLSCAPAQTGSSVRAVTTIPFQFANNLILVPTRINGSEPALFILDTGASASVISLTLAQRLGLKLEGETDVSTSGGSIGGSTVKHAQVSLPGQELGVLSLLAIPLAGLEAGLGRAVGGILGAELFYRFVVEIDYGTRTIQLHDPAGYVYAGPAKPLPITFEDHTPFVRAVVVGSDGNGVEGSLLIDTGANGSLTLKQPFREAESTCRNFAAGDSNYVRCHSGGAVRERTLAVSASCGSAPSISCNRSSTCHKMQWGTKRALPMPASSAERCSVDSSSSPTTPTRESSLSRRFGYPSRSSLT